MKATNVVVWARVSSREQREGYSLDAQIRAIREKAQKDGLNIIKEFSVAESAKRNSDRVEFEKMLSWVKSNARRENLGGLVCHKLDRACRNMRDAIRIQELEDQYGVRPYFVENQFGQGAAGILSFNMMAAISQYYSDNLRSEVLKGMNEKVEQGWLPANAPYGYINTTEDRTEPIRPDPERFKTVQRIFDLYSLGTMTFESITDALQAEGHVYNPSCPKFHRTALSYILNNRFYMGEIMWHKRVFQGKHKPLVDGATFQRCQDILKGKSKRSKGNLHSPMSGGLFRCKYCGQAITGELIRKKLKNGGVNEHVYYRCGNDIQGVDHPKVRWTSADLESAVLGELGKLKLPSAEIADWFRDGVRAALSDEVEYNRTQQAQMSKRLTELQGKRDKLLDAFLGGMVEKELYEPKALEIKTELERIARALTDEVKINASFIETAEKAFNLSQRAPETWAGSNWELRRELLEIFSLNRELDSTSLTLTWNKPFDELVKPIEIKKDRGDRIRTCGLLVPNQAL